MPGWRRRCTGRRRGRDLLDLPALSPLLEEVIGNHGRPEAFAGLPSFRIDHINVHTHVTRGFKGGILHGGWKSTGGSQFFRYHDGQFYNGLVAVVFELFDTHANDGGFCCIPGTHKANLPLPRPVARPEPGHPPQRQAGTGASRRRDRVHRGVDPRHPAVERGGAAPHPVLQILPHGTSWAGAYFDPRNFRDYPRTSDDRKLAILEPPNARYPNRPSRPEPLAASAEGE